MVNGSYSGLVPGHRWSGVKEMTIELAVLIRIPSNKIRPNPRPGTRINLNGRREIGLRYNLKADEGTGVQVHTKWFRIAGKSQKFSPLHLRNCRSDSGIFGAFSRLTPTRTTIQVRDELRNRFGVVRRCAAGSEGTANGSEILKY